MNRADELRELLATEFGVQSDDELYAALRNLTIDISPLVGETSRSDKLEERVAS